MSEFYKRTYNLNELEFDVVRRSENVIITCLDKQLHRSYQDVFTDEIVSNSFSINNLKNFIEIIDWSFTHNSITVIAESRKLNIEINYSNVLEFKFNFTLGQNDQTQLSANSIYIKKLEERIEQLEMDRFVIIGDITLSIGYTIPYPIPIRIDAIVVNTDNNFVQIGNSFYYHSITFDANNSILNIATLSHGNIMFSGFLKLKPKKITFLGSYINSCNKSLFPCEYP